LGTGECDLKRRQKEDYEGSEADGLLKGRREGY